MRNDKTLQLLLNAPIFKETKQRRLNEKDIQLSAIDISDPDKVNYAPILIRVKTKEESNQLFSIIEKQIDIADPAFINENNETEKEE